MVVVEEILHKHSTVGGQRPFALGAFLCVAITTATITNYPSYEGAKCLERY